MSRHGTLARALLVVGVAAGAIVAPGHGSVAAATGPAATSAQVGPSGPARLAAAVPEPWTPQVEDGRVLSIAEIGDRVVAGGTFTSVDPVGGNPVARSHLVIFGTDGTLAEAAPVLDGDVEEVLAGPDPGTVLVAGDFLTVNGVAHPHLVLLDVSNGSVVPSFSPPAIDGSVLDMAIVGSRLLIGGTFTTVGGQQRAGLASFDLATGALDPFLAVQLTENHNWTPECGDACTRGEVGATALAASPDGASLVVVGNFRRADGLVHDQLVIVDLTGPTAAVRGDWNTAEFTATCWKSRFDSYVRDVAFSPDGSFFVVASSGGLQPGPACDTVSRFDVSTHGDDVAPAWRAVSGGDTFLSVAVDDGVVYTGGHGRWVNNDLGRNGAGAGAVARASLAALDSSTGLPLSWNPGRHPRGYGVTTLSIGAQGLWVGSDREWIGNSGGSRSWYRPRLAVFPRTGAVLPAGATPALPATVLLGGNGSGLPALLARPFDGAVARADRVAPSGAVPWASVRGAVMIDGWLYVGKKDASGHWMLWRSKFDGRAFGPLTAVDPYRDPDWCAVSTGVDDDTYYCGRLPAFYNQLARVTALAYAHGRLYYALADSAVLHYRAFSPESGVVGAVEHTVPGTVAAGTPALLLSGRTVYYVDRARDRVLRRTLDAAGLSGTPTVVPGAASTAGWTARAVFLADWRSATADATLAAPSAPRVRSAVVRRNGIAVVRWKAPATHGAAVVGYRVQSKPVRKPSASGQARWRTVATTTRTIARWEPAAPGPGVRVRVVAVSRIGSTAGDSQRLRDRRLSAAHRP